MTTVGGLSAATPNSNGGGMGSGPRAAVVSVWHTTRSVVEPMMSGVLGRGCYVRAVDGDPVTVDFTGSAGKPSQYV